MQKWGFRSLLGNLQPWSSTILSAFHRALPGGHRLSQIPHHYRSHAEIMKMNYDMTDDVLRVKVKAANTGYIFHR